MISFVSNHVVQIFFQWTMALRQKSWSSRGNSSQATQSQLSFFSGSTFCGSESWVTSTSPSVNMVINERILNWGKANIFQVKSCFFPGFLLTAFFPALTELQMTSRKLETAGSRRPLSLPQKDTTPCLQLVSPALTLTAAAAWMLPVTACRRTPYIMILSLFQLNRIVCIFAFWYSSYISAFPTAMTIVKSLQQYNFIYSYFPFVLLLSYILFCV